MKFLIGLACFLIVSVHLLGVSHSRFFEPQYDRLVLVFIPGIYGSTLETPEGTVLWGKDGIGPKGLSLIEHPEAIPELFADVRFNIAFGVGRTLRGYSGFKERAALLLDRKPLVFPYDWRKSNQTSAKALQNFLCVELSEIEKPYRLVFVAHSMGGLVLRHWLKNHLGETTDECDGVDEADIGKIVFAGTPHLGAMETVIALLEGETSLESNPLYSALFTGGLARDAATFESAYELLPARSIAGSGCEAFKGKPVDTKLRLNVGTDRNRTLYLDNIDKWIQLDLPKEVPDQFSRDSFLRVLGKRIISASKIVCELSSYIVPADISRKMNFIVGQMKSRNNPDVLIDNTWDWVEVKKEPGVRRTLTRGKAKGDGTVPVWSAGPSAVNSASMLEAPQRVDKEHSELLDDPLVVSHIQYIFDNVASEVAWLLPIPSGFDEGTTPNYENTLAEVLDSGVAEYSPEIVEHAIRQLAELARQEGMSAQDIYRDARSYTGPNSEAYKAIVFAAAAARGNELNSVSNFWAYQNSAYNWLKVGNENVAIGTALAAGEANAAMLSAGDQSVPPKTALVENERKWRSVIAAFPISNHHPSISDITTAPVVFDPDVFMNASQLGYGSIRYRAEASGDVRG